MRSACRKNLHEITRIFKHNYHLKLYKLVTNNLVTFSQLKSNCKIIFPIIRVGKGMRDLFFIILFKHKMSNVLKFFYKDKDTHDIQQRQI